WGGPETASSPRHRRRTPHHRNCEWNYQKGHSMTSTAGGQVVFREVNKYFGDFAAVVDLNLTIRRGEFFTLLGPSGSGKTTTLRMLAGLETPSSGEISIDGRSVTHTVPEKRNIGLVFQHYALFPHMTVVEN